jgi:hypothetical protein
MLDEKLKKNTLEIACDKTYIDNNNDSSYDVPIQWLLVFSVSLQYKP